MPATLPTTLGARFRHRVGSLGWLLIPAALGVATDAAALEVSVAFPRERNGYVVVDSRLHDLFAPRVRESLARGMPATLQLHAELWRHRAGWFDRLESSSDASIRIRYEVWNGTYWLERGTRDALPVTTLDSVATALSRPWTMPVGRVGELIPRGRYYLVVSAALKPLSVEDVREVEGWLSGELQTRRRGGFGAIAQLPSSLFDAVRNFAGFGDQRARVVSAEFGLRDLFPSR